jgi:signal transduction histidine kinase/DNA-binding response OmpR family regulator
MISELLRHGSREGMMRILLIEDNPGDAGLVEEALEGAADRSLELHVEARLTPALTRLSRERFKVILLDLNLPDSQGFDTVASVQAIAPTIPVIIMTGKADEIFARRAIQAGVQDYLVKDEIRPNDLVRSIFFAIERKSTENDLHALERVASAAGSTLDPESLLDVLLKTLMTEMEADRTAQLLEEDGILVVKKEVGDRRDIDSSEYQETEAWLNAMVLNSNQPIFYELRDLEGTVLRTILRAPLRVSGQARGILGVDWLGPHPESPRENSLLMVAADRIASGLANAQAYQSVKRSEQQAQEERLRLRTIIDTLPVGILITDGRGKEVESNAFRRRIWGGKLRPSESIDDLCKIKAWWADTGEPVLECPVVKALKYGQTTLGAVIDIQRLDGRTGTILNSSAPIVNERREIIGAVGVQQDITDQIRLERELAEAKERAEFYIDLLTHDISNSLTSATGYLQLMDGAGGMPDKLERWLGGAEASLDESIKLIDTIRKVQLSRSLTLENTTVDLTTLLGEVIDQARTKQDGRVKIIYLPAGQALVTGTELLRDLFNNLIGNAIKHSAQNIEIDVAVRSCVLQGQDFVRVDVADNGPGITDEVKARLFRKGERGDSKASGKGLGLFLAMNIVLGAGGRIWVEDRVAGDHTQGARFVVLLPKAIPGHQ